MSENFSSLSKIMAYNFLLSSRYILLREVQNGCLSLKRLKNEKNNISPPYEVRVHWEQEPLPEPSFASVLGPKFSVFSRRSFRRTLVEHLTRRSFWPTPDCRPLDWRDDPTRISRAQWRHVRCPSLTSNVSRSVRGHSNNTRHFFNFENEQVSKYV